MFGCALGAGMAAAVDPPATEPPPVDTPPTPVAPPAPSVPEYRFVSMPDFTNADIADLSHLPTWRPEFGNGTSPEWERGLSNVLDAVQREGVRDLYVAGDFVEGEWGRDELGTGIFGPVDTRDNRRRAVMRAAGVYYRAALRRFADHGLALYPAIGDHEIGDNPWGPAYGGYPGFTYRNLGLFKHAYSRFMMTRPDGTHRFVNRPPGQANGTAYAVRPSPNVQLISLDVFRQGMRKGRRTVLTSIDRPQFDWLDRGLTKANRDGVETIIVQAHTPIIGRIPRRYSSGLMYEKGTGSPLGRLLRRHRVDLYLAGEVHYVSASRRDGLLQIAHGGLAKTGDANYIVVSIGQGTITVEARAFPGSGENPLDGRTLWQTNPLQYSLYADTTYPRDPVTTGRLVVDTSNGEPTEAIGSLVLNRPLPPFTGQQPPRQVTPIDAPPVGETPADPGAPTGSGPDAGAPTAPAGSASGG